MSSKINLLHSNVPILYIDIPLRGYTNCTDGQLRLVGGTELSGRIEICYNRVWYGVCTDDYNTYYEPGTICKGLGFSSQGIVELHLRMPVSQILLNAFVWHC